MDASSEGLLAFVSKNQENDALYIYDTRREKIVDKIKDESLISIASPSWACDSKRIVFEGLDRGGRSDLYLYHIGTRKLKRLTNDIYADRTPAFSNTDNLIAFSSDRSYGGLEDTRNLYIYNLSTSEISQLTYEDQVDESPAWTKLMTGCVRIRPRWRHEHLLYRWVTNGHRATFQLTMVTGAFDPVLAEHDSTIIFAGFQDMTFHIYKMPPTNR
jgi:dipeptidyl aminopeptidase/acylaminoacyl peptidase